MTTRRIIFAAGCLAALALRLAFLVRFSGNFDLESFSMAVDVLKRGGSLYLETNRYNYSPVWAYVLFGLDRLGSLCGVSLAAALGALLLAVDAATAVVLHRLAGGGRRGESAALLFFANPISIFVSSFHLQFDNVAILFLLLALWGSTRREASRLLTVAALSASLLVKHVTAFFPPLFVRRRDEPKPGLRPIEVLVPYAVFAAAFVPFWRQWSGIRRHVLLYRGIAEDYGTAMLLKIPGVPAWAPTAVFVAATGVALVLLRGVERPRACLLLFLVMLLFVPGVCEYYFVWPVALGALSGGAGYAVYTAVVSAFFLGSPDGLNLPIPHLPGWHGIWWSVLLWFAWELRREKRKPTSLPSAAPA